MMHGSYVLTMLAQATPLIETRFVVLGWMLAGLSVVIMGIAKSGFGGGVGIVAVPLFAIAMGPVSGVGTLLPLLIAADTMSVIHHWRRWDIRNLLVLMPGTLVGIAVGIWIIHSAGRSTELERVLQLSIGWICMLYLVAELVKARYAPHWRLRAEPVGGSVAGLAAGVATTLAHAAGPITTTYMMAQHLPKQLFIGTAVIYYFVVNTIKVPPYAALGLIDTSTLWHGLLLLPLIPVGTYLGVRINRWLSERVFRIIILVVVFLSGVSLLWPQGNG